MTPPRQEIVLMAAIITWQFAYQIVLKVFLAHEQSIAEKNAGPGNLTCVDFLLDRNYAFRRTTGMAHTGYALHQIHKGTVWHPRKGFFPARAKIVIRKDQPPAPD